MDENKVATALNTSPRGTQYLFSNIGQQHYDQVSGCLNVITLIREQKEATVHFDPWHLTKSQREEFTEMAKLVSDSLTRAAAAAEEGGKEEYTLSSKDWDPEAYSTFQNLLLSTGRRVTVPKNSELISRSMLVILVSGFETLMTDISAAILTLKPEIANLENSSISLSELRNLGTVEDAKEYLVANFVENLSRGSIEDWDKWFQRIGVNLQNVAGDWIIFREIFARRNLIVHTNGRVSSQYISSLADAGASPASIPDKGSALEPSTEYLEASCQLLMSAGALLVTSVWMKMSPKELEAPIQWSLNAAEAALEDRNFSGSLKIAQKMSALCKDRADLIVDCRLKSATWAAQALMGEDDLVAQEAAKWNVRGVDPLHSHIKAVFEKKYDNALEQIVSLVEANRLPMITVLSSVVYEPLRQALGDRLPEALGIDAQKEMATDV